MIQFMRKVEVETSQSTVAIDLDRCILNLKPNQREKRRIIDFQRHIITIVRPVHRDIWTAPHPAMTDSKVCLCIGEMACARILVAETIY